jgi:hypothetical protein
MEFKGKKIILLGLSMLMFSTLTYADSVSEVHSVDSVSLEECNIDLGTNETINDMVSAVSKCIKSKQDISKANESVEQYLIKEVSTSLVDETFEFQDNMKYFLPFILAGGILLLIAKLKVGMDAGNKSKGMVKMAWFLIISGIIFNPNAFKLFTYEILTKVFYNNLMIVQPQVLLMTQTQMANQEVAKDNDNFEEKTNDIVFGLLNAELCALEQEQETLTKYSFNANTNELASSDYLNCLDTNKSSYRGFFEEGGRSESNFLTKKCSQEIMKKQIDCGKVAAGSQAPTVREMIANKASEARSVVQAYVSGVCNDSIKAIGEQKAEGLCRKVEGESFVLDTETTLEEANKKLLNYFNSFEVEFANALGSDISSEVTTKDYNLLNLVTSIFDLLHSSDSLDLIEDKQNVILGNIAFIKSPNISYTTGEMLEDKDQEYARIEEINDLYSNASNQIRNTKESSEFYSGTKVLGLKLDPLLLIGSFDNPNTREGYMLDHSLYNKTLSLGNYLMFSGAVVYSFDVLFGNSDKKNGNPPVAKALGGFLMFLGIFVYWIFIIVAILMAELIMTIIITMIMLMINLVLMYMSKQDPEIIVEHFMRLIMDISKIGGLIAGLLLSQVALTLSIDLSLHFETVFNVENTFGRNAIEVVRAIAIPIAIMFFNLFLMYKFISLATSNIEKRVNVMSKRETLVRSKLSEGKVADAKVASKRFLSV